MATTTAAFTVELVRCDEPLDVFERAAIAGFLAGYSSNTLVSYTTDLRLFLEWCTNTVCACSRSAEPIWRSSAARWSQRPDALHGRPSTLHARVVLPVLPRRGHPGTQPRSQRSPPEGRRRVTHSRPGPQRTRRPARPGRARLGTRSRVDLASRMTRPTSSPHSSPEHPAPADRPPWPGGSHRYRPAPPVFGQGLGIQRRD